MQWLTLEDRTKQALAAYYDWIGEARNLIRSGDQAGARFAATNAANALARYQAGKAGKGSPRDTKDDPAGGGDR